MSRQLLPIVICAMAMALYSPNHASAQSIGGGARTDLNFASAQNANYSTSPRIGLRAGLFGDLVISDRFSIRAEAAYSMTGVRNADSSSNVTAELDYIEVPLLVVIRLGSLPLSVHTGPALGFAVSSRYTSDLGSGDYPDIVRDRDASWIGGVGVDVSVAGINTTFDARYTHGLRTVFDGPWAGVDGDDKNSVVSVGVGVRLF
jgi:hypothetical protein